MMLVEPPNDRGSTAPSTALPVGPQHQLGFNIYTRLCSTCHGSGQTTMRTPVKLGSTQFRSLIRQGREQMPGFSEVLLPNDQVAALEGYLLSLPVTRDPSGSGDEFVQLPANLTRYPGPDTRYTGSFSAGWYTSNGYPAIGPPWTQLVAYDLNDGTIKWRVPDGQAPGIPESGGSRTGTVRPRNGPVVTAGGLVFVANAQDRFLRAYDTATGRVLWEHELEANPEGIPAVYEVAGRQYIAFAAGASWGTGGDPVWRNPLHRKQGSMTAQGYHVFALPR